MVIHTTALLQEQLARVYLYHKEPHCYPSLNRVITECVSPSRCVQSHIVNQPSIKPYLHGHHHNISLAAGLRSRCLQNSTHQTSRPTNVRRQIQCEVQRFNARVARTTRNKKEENQQLGMRWRVHMAFENPAPHCIRFVEATTK